MENLIFRDAVFSDCESLAFLMAQLGYPTTTQQMQDRFAVIKKQEDYKTIIAEMDGKIIGMSGMIKLYFWEQDGFYLKIQAFVIDKAYHRKGIGKLLMYECEKYARLKKAKVIALTSGNRSEREDAHHFYPAMGFTASSTGYKKNL